MKIVCPACKGAKRDAVMLNPCKPCRARGEMMAMPESEARTLFSDSMEGLASQGYHVTSAVDMLTNLMIAVFPDPYFSVGVVSEVKDAKT